MLRPLLDEDMPAAAELLAEGFPERSLAFWQQGLQRIRRHAGNQAAGVPLGRLMVDGTRLVGVVLTPASLRAKPGGSPFALVNVSSWYVRPEFRWRAGMMFRAVVADPQQVYIDVTPNEEICRMLPLFGFKPMNTGTTLAVLPMLALRPAQGARVRLLRADDRLPVGAPPLEMLLAHRELGCESLLLEHDQGQTLFAYQRRRYRRLPAARLKYVGSHRVLERHLPALARFLLGRGFPLMSWDSRIEAPTRLPLIQRPGRAWYARGHDFDDHTDFIGTELCILGV